MGDGRLFNQPIVEGFCLQSFAIMESAGTKDLVLNNSSHTSMQLWVQF